MEGLIKRLNLRHLCMSLVQLLSSSREMAFVAPPADAHSLIFVFVVGVLERRFSSASPLGAQMRANLR
jgi:hypothetical protein